MDLRVTGCGVAAAIAASIVGVATVEASPVVQSGSKFGVTTSALTWNRCTVGPIVSAKLALTSVGCGEAGKQVRDDRGRVIGRLGRPVGRTGVQRIHLLRNGRVDQIDWNSKLHRGEVLFSSGSRGRVIEAARLHPAYDIGGRPFRLYAARTTLPASLGQGGAPVRSRGSVVGVLVGGSPLSAIASGPVRGGFVTPMAALRSKLG